MYSNLIKNFVLSMGADICGVASIERFEGAPKGFHPSDIYSEAKSVITFAKHFSPELFEANSKAPYTFVKGKISQMLDNISMELVFYMEKQGFKAIPIPSDEPYDYWDSENSHGRGILSLKHSAQAAGIGFIGKNTLLVNEKYGNRLYLAAVITNAVLEEDNLAKNLCPDSCKKCLKECPKAALDGITINQKKCREACITTTPGGGFVYSCFTCRKVCPFSKI
jgi:epoxyqueuosine reductase QueG